PSVVLSYKDHSSEIRAGVVNLSGQFCTENSRPVQSYFWRWLPGRADFREEFRVARLRIGERGEGAAQALPQCRDGAGGIPGEGGRHDRLMRGQDGDAVCGVAHGTMAEPIELPLGIGDDRPGAVMSGEGEKAGMHLLDEQDEPRFVVGDQLALAREN